MCSGFSRVGLNLIREMDFIKSRLVQGWIWFLSLSHKRTKLPRMLLSTTTDCVSSYAFKGSVFTSDFSPTIAQGMCIVS